MYDCKLLPNYEIFRIFVELLKAVGKMHSKNIIHRVLKPSKILLSKQKNVKLDIFGTMKKEDDIETGTIVGTNPYMAPEVWK
jgi:serine/threonine protein kinase